jgi:ABC-2 type transport system permease protein
LSNAFRLYLRFIVVSMKGHLQYRASFIMTMIGHFLLNFITFLSIWALFERFGNVKGWTLAEVGLFYGIVNIAFALAEMAARGFDTFPGMIKTGEFDKLLLRPRSTVLQILGADFQLMRLGRLIQGLIVLFWAAPSIGISWTCGSVALLLAAIAGGTFLFAGLFVLYATVSFWTTESLEIFNAVTYGGVETAQFPLTLYHPWLRTFFTFVVPLACINYFPIHAILQRHDTLESSVLFQTLSPAIGLIFFLVTLQFWELGVRHYRSTGS